MRILRGWTQTQLAQRLGLDRRTIAKWESGCEPVPRKREAQVAAVLGLQVAQLRQQWPVLPPLPELTIPPLFAPDYPVRGTVEEMLDLGPVARALAAQLPDNPSLHFELRERFPRDSPWELLAAYHLVSEGAALEFRSTNELYCPQLVTERMANRAEGHALRHCLRWQTADATVLLLPQVTLAVVPQAQKRRVDFLVLYLGRQHNLWIDVEIDGQFHLETANEDSRRAVGLGLPLRRYANPVLLTRDFPKRLLNDLRYLHDNHRVAA